MCQARQIRQAIRNAYLCESVDVLTAAEERARLHDETAQADALQDMIDKCRQHNVTNYGDTPL